MNTLSYQYSIETSTFDAIKTTSLSQFLENQYWIERYKYNFLSPSPVQPITDPLPTSGFKLRAFVEETSSVTLIHVILQQVSLCTSKTLRKSQEYTGFNIAGSHRLQKTPFSKQFPSIRKRSVGIFKFLRFEGQTDRQSL